MDSQIVYSGDRVRKLIEFTEFRDTRGSLTPIELSKDVPFDVKSIRWGRGEDVKSVVEEISIDSSSLIIALSGCVELVVDDIHFVLDRPNVGLLIAEVSDLKLVEQSDDLICLILSDIECLDFGKSKSKEHVSSRSYSVRECRMIDLSDSQALNIPFSVQRLFYIYDIPDDVVRGGHVHRTCHEVLIALNGVFDVELNDGYTDSIVGLNNMSEGLFLPAGIWARQTNYSDKALCLVFASEEYSNDGYIDTYDDFIKYRKNEDTSI